MVRYCNDGVSSRTGRRLGFRGFRVVVVISPTSSSDRLMA
jgi:hypothetical protein